jgi:hypothetical protein
MERNLYIGKGTKEMTQTRYIKATIFLAALLAAIVLAATGESAKADFPGSTGAIAFVSTRDGATTSTG